MTNMKAIQLFTSFAIAVALAGCAAPKQQHCTNACVSMLQPEETTTAATQLDVSGNWSWVCCDKKYSGKLELSQATDGSLSGKMFEASGDEAGKLAGRIKGGNVQFTRSWGDGLEQTYTLTLGADGKTLTGTLDGSHDETVGVDFEAKKL